MGSKIWESHQNYRIITSTVVTRICTSVEDLEFCDDNTKSSINSKKCDIKGRGVKKLCDVIY